MVLADETLPMNKPLHSSPLSNRPEEGLQRWVREHQEAAISSWQQLWRRPLLNMLTWLTLAVTLALPGMLIIMLGQLQDLAGQVPTNHQMSVFLQLSIEDKQGQAITQQLLDHEYVDSAQFVTANQALQEFSQASGLGDVFANLTYNPIPATILIETSHHDTITVNQLAAEIGALEGVDQVILNQEWMERIQLLVSFGERGVWILTLLLALGVILVMTNSIRLQLVHHHEEMVVMKLIGGTNAYLRRPFLYAAIWYGCIAGVLACVIMAIALVVLQNPLNALAVSFNSVWLLVNLSGFNVLLALLGSCVLTLIGTLLSVNKQLAVIEPQ